MHLSHDGKFIRSDIWREGEYLDLWSVPHFLSGIVMGLIMHFLGFQILPTFIIAILTLVGYEMFEVIVKIKETRMNRVLDVVVGMASFSPAFLLAPMFSETQNLIALVSVLSIDVVISWFGWDASQKAAGIESRLRAEFEAQKARMGKRGNRIRKRFKERRLERLKKREV